MRMAAVHVLASVRRLGDAEILAPPATVKRADRAVPVIIWASLFHESFPLHIHHSLIGSTFLCSSRRMAQST